MIDAEVGVGRSAIGDGFGPAAEIGEIGVVRIIAIQDDDFGIHLEQGGFGIKIGINVGVIKARRHKIGEGGDVNWEAEESAAAEGRSWGCNNSISRLGFPGVVEKFV